VVELDRSAIDGLAARVLESGMAPAVALAVTDRDRTLLGRTYGAASPDAFWPVGSIAWLAWKRPWGSTRALIAVSRL
jgi:hypothetical protein